MRRVKVKKCRPFKRQTEKVALNLLYRELQAKKSKQKRATDVMAFSLFCKKIYLSSILDLHNGYMVNYTILAQLLLNIVAAMLTKTSENTPMARM